MCSSMVVVEDTSPPYSKICPSGIVRHSQLNRQFPFDPRFQDNTGISSIDVSGLPGKIFLSENQYFKFMLNSEKFSRMILYKNTLISDVPMEPGEYLVTYRAVDKYGNTGVCQIQLLVESPINQVTIRPHVTYSKTIKTTIQPYLDQITSTKKLSTTPKSLTSGPICQNIRPPENGQGSIFGDIFMLSLKKYNLPI